MKPLNSWQPYSHSISCLEVVEVHGAKRAKESLFKIEIMQYTVHKYTKYTNWILYTLGEKFVDVCCICVRFMVQD